jgi:cytochrome c
MRLRRLLPGERQTAKYCGSQGAGQMLFDKVRNGGVGVWGQIPMPSNASVPDAELQAMITLIFCREPSVKK